MTRLNELMMIKIDEMYNESLFTGTDKEMSPVEGVPLNYVKGI